MLKLYNGRTMEQALKESIPKRKLKEKKKPKKEKEEDDDDEN